jgi:hypothetical protein
MGGERVATMANHLATWTWYGLVAVGWVVIAALAALACLAYIGLFDVSHHLAGPGGMGHQVGIVAHGIATGAG